MKGVFYCLGLITELHFYMLEFFALVGRDVFFTFFFFCLLKRGVTERDLTCNDISHLTAAVCP